LVQPRGVRRIDAYFQRLQPVAVPVALEREGVLARRDERVELRKCGCFAFAEIREDDSASLDHRICAQANVLAQAAPGRLGRRLEALAGRIEEPAVKRAAQSSVLEPPVGEIGPAVCTLPLDQA